MKRKFYMKVVFGYLVFCTLVFIIICTFTQHMISNYMIQLEVYSLYNEATLLASNYSKNNNMDELSREESQQQAQAISQYLSCDIWIVDLSGNILMKTANSSLESDHNFSETISSMDEFNIQDFENKQYMIGDFYGAFNQEYISVAAPISLHYRNNGYILIHKPVYLITRTSNSFLNIYFYTTALIFLCAFVIVAFFTHFMYHPLHKIILATNRYAKGDFTAPIDVHGSDEIGYLASTLNYMATTLNTRDEDQRKFISNVSHDFRSPLTSIKGYVEAMQDGTIPAEMQEKYLNIILFETERLNKLTQNLLDLNRFGNNGLMLDISDFDINQLIQSTLPTFEGSCKEKNINIKLALEGQELIVSGDMNKIQRVIYNLIDNAVKFSNNDSVIRIETSIKNEKVLISVKDSGIGIPSDSIHKIWDRFYKTDLSRGRDKRGSGLGLAIIKEIIQAHNEHINVVSTEGVGSEFLFTLPLSQKETLQ